MKKILIVSVLLNVGLLGIFAYRRLSAKEKVKEDPNIYQKTRTRFFKSLPKDSGAVYFIGNSLASEYPVQDLFPNLKVHDWGVSGSETKNTLARVDEMMSRKPSKIFLVDGINDLKNGVDFDTALFRYKQIVQKIKTTDYYLISVLPVTGQFARLNNEIIRFNDSIRILGKFIDLYPMFAQNGQMNSKYTYDGLHLTADGYSIVTSVLKHLQITDK